MFEFRPTYQPLVTLCKELIAEKKALMEENEGLKETLRCLRQDNEALRAKLFSTPNDDKLADLEKRVVYLEDRLSPVEALGEPEPTEEKLEVGKWYDARTFEIKKLKELLPVGTKVAIITDSQKDEAEAINQKVPTCISKVTKVVKEYDVMKSKKQTAVYADIYQFVPNNWFKIIEE